MLTEIFLNFLGIGTQLEENLGQIEKVNGHIVIIESASLTSLNFFKNLREIRPRLIYNFLSRPPAMETDLYNERCV